MRDLIYSSQRWDWEVVGKAARVNGTIKNERKLRVGEDDICGELQYVPMELHLGNFLRRVICNFKSSKTNWSDSYCILASNINWRRHGVRWETHKINPLDCRYRRNLRESWSSREDFLRAFRRNPSTSLNFPGQFRSSRMWRTQLHVVNLLVPLRNWENNATFEAHFSDYVANSSSLLCYCLCNKKKIPEWLSIIWGVKGLASLIQ